MTKRTIVINADYRLSIDVDNIQIERQVTVDPTKAPAYDPEKHVATIRSEWRSIGKYYSNLGAAFEGVLKHALSSGPDTDVRGLLIEIQSFRAHIDGLLGAEV